MVSDVPAQDALNMMLKMALANGIIAEKGAELASTIASKSLYRM